MNLSIPTTALLAVLQLIYGKERDQMSRYLIVLLLVSIFNGCSTNKSEATKEDNSYAFYEYLDSVITSRKYYLSPEELNLNPYRQGDILIFKSSHGSTSRVAVDSFRMGFPDAPGLLDHYYQILTVDRYGYGELLEIKAKTPKEDTRIYFHVPFPGASFCCKSYELEKLDWSNDTTMTIQGSIYTDILVIKQVPEEHQNNPEPGFVKKLYWSKSVGYIRADYNNGVVWELAEKRSN